MADRAALGSSWATFKNGTLWRKYAGSNPAESKRVDAYAAAIAAGQNPSPPSVSTDTGRGLAGIIASGFPASAETIIRPPTAKATAMAINVTVRSTTTPTPLPTLGAALPTRLPFSSESQILYVNPTTGNDTTGTGTDVAPYQTINKAISLINLAGGVVEVVGSGVTIGGTTPPLSFSRAGSPANPVTIRCRTQWGVTLAPSPTNVPGAYVGQGGTGLRIQGFVLSASGIDSIGAWLDAGSRDLELYKCKIYHSGGMGVSARGGIVGTIKESNRHAIYACWIQENGQNPPDAVFGTRATHGLYMGVVSFATDATDNAGVQTIVVASNIFYGSEPGSSAQFGPQAHNVFFVNNTCVNNSGDPTWGGASRDSAAGSSVSIYSNATTPYRSHDVIMKNNIMAFNYGHAIRGTANADMPTNVAENNLAYSNSNSWVPSQGDYCMFPGSTRIFSIGPAGNLANADPLFTNRAAGDLRLQAGSPGIGVSQLDYTPLTDYNGNARTAYNLGALESEVAAATYVDSYCPAGADNPLSGQWTLPATAAAGDIAIVYWGSYFGRTLTPTGPTQLEMITTGQGTKYVGYRILTSGDISAGYAGTWSATSTAASSTAWGCSVFRGDSDAWVFDATDTIATGNSSTIVDVADITTATATDLLVCVGFKVETTSSSPPTAPTGLTLDNTGSPNTSWVTFSGTAHGYVVMCAYKLNAGAAGAQSLDSFACVTAASVYGAGVTLAIKAPVAATTSLTSPPAIGSAPVATYTVDYNVAPPAASASATATAPAVSGGANPALVAPPAIATAMITPPAVAAYGDVIPVPNVRLLIQAAFGSNPTDEGYNWTDISSYVAGGGTLVTYRRGRQNELGQVETGSGSIDLVDRNSDFDPDNPTGVYSTRAKPMVPVRVIARVKVGGVTTDYPMFLHYVDRWPRTLRSTNKVTKRTISTVDGFAWLARAGLGGAVFPEQTSGERFTAVLDYINWPVSLRSIDQGNTTVVAVTYAADNNTTALSHLLEVADSEAGFPYIDAQGRVRLVARHALLKPPYSTPVITLSDIAALGSRYQDLARSYDLDQVTNEFTGTREGGVAQTAADTASQTAYAKRSATFSSLANSDVEVLAQAQWKLRQFKDPLNRVESIEVMPATSATGWAALLGLDLGSRFTITEQAPGFASPKSVDYTAEALEVTVDAGPPHLAKFKYQLWPADPSGTTTPWIILDDPGAAGKLAEGVLAY